MLKVKWDYSKDLYFQICTLKYREWNRALKIQSRGHYRYTGKTFDGGLKKFGIEIVTWEVFLGDRKKQYLVVG